MPMITISPRCLPASEYNVSDDNASEQGGAHRARTLAATTMAGGRHHEGLKAAAGYLAFNLDDYQTQPQPLVEITLVYR